MATPAIVSVHSNNLAVQAVHKQYNKQQQPQRWQQEQECGRSRVGTRQNVSTTSSHTGSCYLISVAVLTMAVEGIRRVVGLIEQQQQQHMLLKCANAFAALAETHPGSNKEVAGNIDWQ